MNEILDVFWMNPIGQTLGLLWMWSAICAFLQKNDKNVVYILSIAHIFWAAHFLFMEIYSWIGMVIVGLLRLVLSLKYKRNNKMFFTILLITVILGSLTYQDINSLLPTIASILWTYWFFYLEKIKLRLLLLFVSGFWFSFHYVNFSIGWVINEGILEIIHLATIYRLIVESWWTRAFFRNLLEKIIHRPKIDYWRYLTLIDLMKMKLKK